MKRAVLFFFLCAAPVLTAPAADPFSWSNSLRAALGLRFLQKDDALMRTARSYAAELAALGRISHWGEDGSDALTRYLRNGGTSARVGEIIGAGESLSDVEKAWRASPAHSSVLLRPYWTHSGWGCAAAGGKTVWVALFVQKRVEGLKIQSGLAEGFRIQGRLLPTDAEKPVLLSGIERAYPDYWNPASGSFVFTLPRSLWSGYVRLGYIPRSGGLLITDVITSPRGTGCPTAENRFEGLGERP